MPAAPDCNVNPGRSHRRQASSAACQTAHTSCAWAVQALQSWMALWKTGLSGAFTMYSVL